MAAATGVRQRHGNGCKRPASGCKCPWQAEVYSAADRKKIRKLFGTKAAATAWREDAGGQVRRKELRAPVATTLDEAADAWLAGARSGLICNRSGDPYKPAAIRAYEATLRVRVRPALGHRRVSDITRRDLQDFADGLLAEGLAASTIGVALLPLRAIYRRAIQRGEVSVNPTSGLQLPRVRGGRDRIATPEQAERLLEALPRGDRALWATAMFAGLRRGELMGLRVEDVDLAAGVIHVRRGWDPKEGEIPTKTRKPRRVPIAAILRDHLDEHLLLLDWREDPQGFVFGVSASSPYTMTPLSYRARKVWKAAKLEPITLHECRHTFASLMIAAGVNAKALAEYMGHANISITMDRYGHLMPGNEEQAAGLLDAYLRADADARGRAAEIDLETGTNTGTSQ